MKREKIHLQCGGAWPFLVDGVLGLVHPVSVKYDCSLISFSAPWQVNSFFDICELFIYSMQLQFAVFFLFFLVMQLQFQNFQNCLVMQLQYFFFAEINSA